MEDPEVVAAIMAGDPAGLAEALGVSRNHAHALLSRARSQLERSLGALIVARTGRADCADLDAMLAGWDGQLTVLMRKRISRHIEQCEVCGERKRRELTPALFAAAAHVAGPWQHVLHHRHAVTAGAATSVMAAGAIVAGIMAGTHHGQPSAGPAGGSTHGASGGTTAAPAPARGGPSGKNGSSGKNGTNAGNSGGQGLAPSASTHGGTATPVALRSSGASSSPAASTSPAPSAASSSP